MSFKNKPLLLTLFALFPWMPVSATDHNEPDAINAIFDDVASDASDLYGLFGFPEQTKNGEVLNVIMTFAPAPATGVFDEGVLHKINLDADTRVTPPSFKSTDSLPKQVAQLDQALSEAHTPRIPGKHPEIFVTYQNNGGWYARVEFRNFTFNEKEYGAKHLYATNVATGFSINNKSVDIFVGGRDDPFFTDLHGFFKSINYAPYLEAPFKRQESQFGVMNWNPRDLEQKKVKSLLKLDNTGNFLVNAQGQLESVYRGTDDRARYNVNAIALRIPMDYITPYPAQKRVVRVWGEGYRLKAGKKSLKYFNKRDSVSHGELQHSALPLLSNYVRKDTLGIPFVDTVIGERKESFNTGANNLRLQLKYVERLAHLAWGFAPALEKMGFDSCFRQKATEVSIAKATPIWYLTRCLLQQLRMPDESWKRNPQAIVQPPRVLSLFHPNTLNVDMDTTGTWPFGRRPEDQVASRFTSLFLDHSAGRCGKITGNEHNCHVESLQIPPANQAVVGLPINPPKNDKEFLQEFPFLAPPWEGSDEVRQQ